MDEKLKLDIYEDRGIFKTLDIANSIDDIKAGDFAYITSIQSSVVSSNGGIFDTIKMPSKIDVVQGHYAGHCNIKNLPGFYAVNGTILDVRDNAGNYSYYICENGLWNEISDESTVIFI